MLIQSNFTFVKTPSCTATANIRNRENRRQDTWPALVPRERRGVQVFGEPSVPRKGDEGLAGRQKAARDDAGRVASSIPTARPNATSATGKLAKGRFPRLVTRGQLPDRQLPRSKGAITEKLAKAAKTENCSLRRQFTRTNT